MQRSWPDSCWADCSMMSEWIVRRSVFGAQSHTSQLVLCFETLGTATTPHAVIAAVLLASLRRAVVTVKVHGNQADALCALHN